MMMYMRSKFREERSRYRYRQIYRLLVFKNVTTTTMSAKSTSAIRLVFSSAGKTKLRFVFLQCRVKPGANKQREGIVAVTEEVIDLCVSAQAREGEANKAVKGLFSKVCWAAHSDSVTTDCRLLT